MLKVSIVGRPNVGKSTLYNKLILSSDKAIAHNTSGTTRDYKMEKGSISDLEFIVIDTGGVEIGRKTDENSLEHGIRKQTELAITKSDVILFVVEAKSGITDLDKDFARWIRKTNLPIILLVNKCDAKASTTQLDDFHRLGFKDQCFISAEHKRGFDQLYEALSKYNTYVPVEDIEEEETEGEDSENFDETPDMQEENLTKFSLAIIGRPNVGKSTFINALLNEERVMTGPMAGLTRDSIKIPLKFKGYDITIIDTAGLRKKKNVEEDIEILSARQSRNTIERAQIIMLLIDVENGIETQDIKIASLAIENTTPIIIVVNKVDLIKKDKQPDIKKEFTWLLEKKVPQVLDIPMVFISSKNKYNIHRAMDSALDAWNLSHIKISTPKLNNWLHEAMDRHQPPLSTMGNRIKFKFIRQIRTCPPIFKLFVNKPKEVPTHYLRYLAKSLQDEFKFQSIPVKLILTSSPNPYADKG